MKKLLWRLLVLVLSVSMIVSFSLISCKKEAPPVEEEVVEEEVVEEEVVEEEVALPEEVVYKEAPMLADMVAAGELPPVEERLPENPLVIEPFEEIGEYSDTLRRGTGFFMPDEWFISHWTMESLFTFDWPIPGEGPIKPNLAEKWEFNEDGTELTVYLRKGIKWSDGEPFTVDDILFFLFDILEDENVAYTWYHVPNLYYEGELPEIEKIDDYTIKFSYPESYFFAETAYSCLCEIALPKHHFEQFHPKYNPDATYEDLNENIPWSSGRGRVTLMAWMLEDYSPDEKMTIVRNPYYWKVDPEGKQLPYFDKNEIFVAGDRQGVAMGNMTGDYDLDNMWVGIQHLSLFLEEQEERDYTIGHSIVAGMTIFFNIDAPDEEARTVVRNKDLRQACSLAINRLEIDRTFFYDNLVPLGCSFSPDSPYYEEEVGKLYSEYDPERAKQILDDADIIDRDGDGIRELPTGEKCEVVWTVPVHDLYSPISEMVVKDLAEVGINFILNIQHQNLVTERRLAGEFETITYDFSSWVEPLADLDWWVPAVEGAPFWHKNAIDEPFCEDYEKFVELLIGAKSLPYEERVAALKEANEIMAENVFEIHIGGYKRTNISSNRLGNCPRIVARIDEFGSTGPEWLPYQLYEKYKPGEKPEE